MFKNNKVKAATKPCQSRIQKSKSCEQSLSNPNFDTKREQEVNARGIKWAC